MRINLQDSLHYINEEGVICVNTPFTFTHHRPKNEQPATTYPAIFLLHGMGSNEQDLLQLIDTVPAHIFAVRGPIAHGNGYAFFTIGEEEQPVRAIFDKVVLAFSQFVEQALIEFSINPQQVYVVGFNQGAVIAQSAAFVLGNQVTGVAALSGFLPQFVQEEYVKKDISQVAFFMSHGTYDYIYPIKEAEQAAVFFEACGANVTLMTYEDGHGVTPQNRADFNDFLHQHIAKV